MINKICKIVFQNGTILQGTSLGYIGTTGGEVCFNTSMTGYQEILTDPSYSGQMITMTYPHIGNYGINNEDIESSKIQCSGFIVKEAAEFPSNFRSKISLDEYLEKNPNTYNKISSILEQNSMENFLKIYELFVNHKDDEQFEKIKTKTLIMTGEGDIGSTPEMSINLSKVINNSNVKIISKGKHLCSIECADDVNMTIKKHIQND